MRKFLLIDLANLLFRAKFVVKGDIETAVGLCIHIVLNSIKSVDKKYGSDHVVFCFEGKSWRKQYDSSYKLNRKQKRDSLSEHEKKNDEVFFAAFNEFQNFLRKYTNCTILQNNILEADDLVAAWIQNHPEDNHIIVSGDTDFQQLISENVTLYDGVNKKTYTINGVFDERDKPILEKKTKTPIIVNPEYLLFKKIIRGDTSDNIFPAYPGVREKKIIEAFADRFNKGYAWNNFMNSSWEDHEKNQILVKDRFLHNKQLIDLSAQPSIIKEEMVSTVQEAYTQKKDIKNIGFSFIKFCGKFNLVSLAESSKDLVTIFSKSIPE